MYTKIHLKTERKVSDLEYINNKITYEVKTMDWQMIRPSFLVFLNYVIPRACSPWKEPETLQIVEVGVAGGLNAELMLKAYKHTFLHLVDNYEEGQSPDSMLKLLEPFSERIKFVHKKSVEAAKEYPDGYFDYVYIDGLHDYANVFQDLNSWYPKVKMEGMMAGHDWWFGDVKKAITDFLQNHLQRIYGIQQYFEEIRSTYLKAEESQCMDWWFVKRAQEGKNA